MVSYMADMKQVIEKLVQSTEEGRVAWRNSSEPGVFRASVGHSTIFITGYDVWGSVEHLSLYPG